MGGCLTGMGGCLTGIGGCLTDMGGCLAEMGGCLTDIGGCLTGIVTEKKNDLSRRTRSQITGESLIFWEKCLDYTTLNCLLYMKVNIFNFRHMDAVRVFPSLCCKD